MTRTFVSVLLATLAASSVASADRLPLLTMQPTHEAQHTDVVGGLTIFLNKCEGGCAVRPGMDDATTNTTDLVGAATTLQAFAWQPGEWEGLVQCVKEVYSPYNVIITDTRPGGVYNEVIVAGGFNAIQANPSCGIAFVNPDCSIRQNAVSFAFTDDNCYAQSKSEDPDPSGTTGIRGMCWTVAQETAHSIGLDHAFGKFDSGQSTCNDPMTYQADCGGQKFFRNDFAPCNGNDGKVKPGCGPADSCATKQNSHLKLLETLGPGTPITTPPVVTNQVPANGATVKAGTPIIVKAFAQRGVATVELWINGYKWDSQKGVAFGQLGQLESPYTFMLPAGVPDSKLDITVKGFDDIGIEGDGATISAIKGKAAGCDPSITNPDGTIDTCLKGMQCTAGKCAWTDAGTGAFGDACTYPQFCMSGTCNGTAAQQICTHDCSISVTDACPMGYDCVSTGGDNGICFPIQPGGGCCSVGSEGLPAIAAHGGLALLTLGVLFGRRRKRVG